MKKFGELGEKIKTLKMARDILHDEYEKSEFHKKKEANPDDTLMILFLRHQKMKKSTSF
jgi:hypothetical protein